jgi:tetratricopeptide (TPR) repeat protein
MYLQTGQPEVAEPLLQRAVVLERSGGTGGKVRLPGARALLGGARRRLGRLAEAREILQEAVAAYEADEHLYAATFTVLARCELGLVAEVEGHLEEALGHYLVAGALCEARRERLGTAQLGVRARLGQARIHAALGQRDASRLLADARRALDPSAPEHPKWVWEGSDALLQFDLAHTEARLGAGDEALRTLRRAVDWGWGDLPTLRQLPGLEAAFGREPLSSVLSLVESRGGLPAYPPTLLADTEGALSRPPG